MNNDETFCIYCQHKYATPKALRKHIEREHPDTYAFYNVNVPEELLHDERRVVWKP